MPGFGLAFQFRFKCQSNTDEKPDLTLAGFRKDHLFGYFAGFRDLRNPDGEYEDFYPSCQCDDVEAICGPAVVSAYT